MKPTYRKSFAWMSSDVRFDHGPLHEGQTRIAKAKITYNSLVIGPRALGWLTNIYIKIMSWKSSGLVGFDLEPLFLAQTRIAKLKSAYNSLIIGPRGLGWWPNT